MTAVQPAARAGPSLRVIIAKGKFQGVKSDLDEVSGFASHRDIAEYYAHHTWTREYLCKVKSFDNN